MTEPIEINVGEVSSLPQLGDWFLVHTKSRQESVLAADLKARDIGYYLPMLTHTRSYGKRKVKLDLPMFPGYLFLRGSIDDTYLADRTRRVAHVIPVRDQQAFQEEIVNLHLAESKIAPLDPHPFLQSGVRVEVRSGAFRGLCGVIEDRTKMNRLLLQVDMLGRAMSMEVDGALLEVIE